MKQTHMVTAGCYDGYQVIRVFEDRQDAERFALEYNATTSWTDKDDRARVKEIDFVPARQATKMMEVVR